MEAVTSAMLALLEPGRGEIVLELGCGVGALGARVAQLVGPDGRVIVSDVAEGMVAAARRRLEPSSLPNVELQVLDGEAIDLPDASVDAVICRMGYMLMPDPGGAFTEARRVLRSNGRLVFSVWGAAQQNVWASCLGIAVMQSGLDGGGDPFAPGGPFSLSDPSTLRALLSGAGFSDVQIDEVDSPHVFEDLESYWVKTTRLAGPLAVTLSDTPKEKLDEVKRNVSGLASQYIASDGLVMPGRALVVRAS
ncbi:MAG: class I SAM-dependent methyltransferase [Actinomycetota bacterium]